MSGFSSKATPSIPDKKRYLDFCFVLLGKFSMIGVILLGGIITARMGGAEEYAIFILVISSALVIDGVLGTSLDLTVIRYATDDPNISRERIHRCQALAFHIKWLSVVGLLLAYCLLQHMFHLESLASYPILSVLLVGLGLLLSRSVLVDAQIQKKFRIYSAVDGVQGLVRMAFFGVLALTGVTQAHYYLGAYGGTGVLVLFIGVWGLKQKFVLAQLPGGAEVKQLFHFAGAMTFIIACGTLTGRGDIILLSFSQSKIDLAHYGVASQIVQLLIQLSLYSSVLTQPRIIQDLREGTLNKLLGLNVIIVIGLSLLSVIFWYSGVFDWGVQFLFGQDFKPALPLLKILYIGGIFDLLLVPVLVTLGVLVAPKWCAWGELAITILFFSVGYFIIHTMAADQARFAMAWTFVGVRVCKLLFYCLLYLRIAVKPKPFISKINDPA